MAHTIPLTHYGEYVAQAKAIRQNLRDQTAPAAIRQAVVDLADLAVRALDESAQVYEGLAALVMAMHPEVTRRRGPGNR